jgi:hypothetical protein
MVPLALGLLAAACSGNGGGSAQGTTTAPPTTASVSPSPSSSPSVSGSQTPSPSPSVAGVLEDGRYFGYIRSIDMSSQTLVFDLAYFLTGDEANQAAAEHGDETPVPNDYYIVNDNPKLRTLDVAPDVTVRVIDWNHCCKLVTGEIQPFVDAFATKHHEWGAMYQGSKAAYWLTVRAGLVTRIEEQYFP